LSAKRGRKARIRAAIRRGHLAGGSAVASVETSSFVVDPTAGQVRLGYRLDP